MTSIQLRSVQPHDVDWIFRACQDPEIQCWTLVPRPYEMKHAQSFVDDGAGELMRFVIEDQNQSEGHGLVSLHSIDPVSMIADIGYWVAPWSRGRGIGSRAIQLLIDVVCTQTEAKYLVANIAQRNIASQAVVLRAGFEQCGQQMGPATFDLQPVLTVVYRYSMGR